ncbi:HPP family protein [Amycolatopsis sp. YIM 10]|uniref:CBS domain-containing protein n=1 Tax=Amycolatopsis sp. YIM 10 TaxID=2653857 RepID=UPI0012905085|nr:CBS domain-containing protein [Amycolatopsis sp. YIM 10]QFU89639.1 CBS domain protein [Amycolatopsis sp. YIM 10]
MHAREIMSTPVIAVSAQPTIEEAVREMLARGFTTMPVVESSGRLLGLVTEADLGLSRLALNARDRSGPDDGVLLGLTRRTVAAVMCTPAPTIDAGADLTEAAQRLVHSGRRCLPVAAGSLVIGMLSWRDLLRTMLLDRTR